MVIIVCNAVSEVSSDSVYLPNIDAHGGHSMGARIAGMTMLKGNLAESGTWIPTSSLTRATAGKRVVMLKLSTSSETLELIPIEGILKLIEPSKRLN